MAAASACNVGAVASFASPTAALVSVARPRDSSSWKHVTRLLGRNISQYNIMEKYNNMNSERDGGLLTLVGQYKLNKIITRGYNPHKEWCVVIPKTEG